jgi:acetate kinase
MGTRSGSIDPGIVFRLIGAGLPPDDIERALDHESGLRAVAGTQDMRDQLEREERGDDAARLAIEMFIRRAAAAIAAASTTLDNLDAVVFTGGIGEHAASVRSRICGRLSGVGIPEPSAMAAGEGVVARGEQGPAVIVVHAREDVVIAESALGLAGP